MENTEAVTSRPWRLAGFFVAAGTLVPWLTALGVKLWLDSVGSPTYPISPFLNPGTILGLLAWTLVFWAFPFGILGILALVAPTARLGLDTSRPGWSRPLWAAFIVGVSVEIPLFVGIFWEWNAITLMLPLGVYLLIPMAGAYLGVWWWTRRGGAGGSTPSPAPGTGRPASPGTPPPPPAR